MSVVSREEIDRMAGYYDTVRDEIEAKLLCERVAALVEQKMKERVCEWCGGDDEIAFDERINEGWCGKCDKAIGNTTRAQYEADSEGER